MKGEFAQQACGLCPPKFKEKTVSLNCLLALPGGEFQASTVKISGVRTFMHFSFYWGGVAIGFTSKINSLGTNESLSFISLSTVNSRAQNEFGRELRLLRSAVAERQNFQKFLKIRVIPGINPKFDLLSLESLLELLFPSL